MAWGRVGSVDGAGPGTVAAVGGWVAKLLAPVVAVVAVVAEVAVAPVVAEVAVG